MHTEVQQHGRTITVHVRPGAPRTCVRGTLADGSLKIDLATPAERGKANAALVHFLAEYHGVPPSKVEILSGRKNRTKKVRILPAVRPSPP